MKLKIDYRLPLMLTGGVIFQLLFWNEFLGLNLLLYSVFILLITIWNKDLHNSKNKLITATIHLLIAFYVCYNNTALAIFTWFVTLFTYIGSVHFPLLKSTFTKLFYGIIQLISGPYGFFTKLQATRFGKINFKPLTQLFKYVVFPLLLVVIFCSLYSNANPIFAKYIATVTNQINQFFSKIFSFIFVDISFAKCGMILLGTLITAALLVGINASFFGNIELNANDNLVRKRKKVNFNEFIQDFRILLSGNQSQKKLGLKTEHTIAILSFSVLNLLLLLLNGIDIATLWLNNSQTINKNFSSELHDGTNVLIFSIVIAMLIIVYFFSGNLNFYSRNRWIKWLAYVWIVQNTILIASVLHRDYDYIWYHGLTYKRIGVAVFALLCLVGLLTVYIKVANKKTVFYLYRVNSKIWYMLLVILSLVNWDPMIVRYNFSRASKIGVDVDHLMSFSDKTLPILKQNRLLLSKNAALTALNRDDTPTYEVQKTVTTGTVAQKTATAATEKVNRKNLLIKQATDNFNETLDHRIRLFLKQQRETNWLSFSYINWQTKNDLLKK